MARQEGNDLFKAGKFVEALAKYEDAMKRDPKSHVPYSNRAACYQKLMEWQLALKDAETCVSMEPTFVKASDLSCKSARGSRVSWPCTRA